MIIPLKALDSAKGRLADALEPQQRREFVAWMACRVIAAAAGCDEVARILVVAGDEAAAEVGASAGTQTLLVVEAGLAVAMAAADEATADAPATLVLAADLPHATPDDIRAVLAAGSAGPRAVAIAPTTDGGTGALLRRPAAIIATAYGPGSAAAHERLAHAAAINAVRVHRPGLALDVDTPGELPAALALAAGADVGCPPRC